MSASQTNLVVLAGRLTAEPISRHDGQIAQLRIASNRFFRSNGSDETKEETTFVDATAFGYEAVAALAHLKKGSPLQVEGRLELHRWESDGGEKRQQVRIHVSSISSPDLRPQAADPQAAQPQDEMTPA